MAHIHCLISLDKGKEPNAGSICDLLLVCDLGRIKRKNLGFEFSMFFPMVKIHEATSEDYLSFNKIFILILHID